MYAGSSVLAPQQTAMGGVTELPSLLLHNELSGPDVRLTKNCTLSKCWAGLSPLLVCSPAIPVQEILTRTLYRRISAPIWQF